MEIDGLPKKKERSSNRMRIHKKFWWFITVTTSATLIVLFTNFFLLWKQMEAGDQAVVRMIVTEYFGYFFIALFFVLTVIGFTIEWFFRFYIIPVNQLAEETHLVTTVNPTLNVRVQGSADVRRLAKMIIENGEAMARMKQSLDHQIKLAELQSKNEKEVLAALLADLPQGILVCNADGHIVFYNRKVRDLLERHGVRRTEESEGESQWVGLGRSVYTFIDQTLISRALERVADKIAKEQYTVNERFLVTTSDKATLPAELLPVLDSRRYITGFIVYIEDLVAEMQREAAVSKHMQAWQHQMTQSISVVKAAVDILKDESFKSVQERNQMIQILAEQSDLAAELLLRNDFSEQWATDRPWPLTPTPVEEWAQFIVQRVDEVLDIRMVVDDSDVSAQISIDTHHLTSAIIFILKSASRSHRIQSAKAYFHQENAWLYLDITWVGEGITNALLKKLKREYLDVNASKLTLSLADILVFHGAKLWALGHHASEGQTGIRLLIPILGGYEIVHANGHMTILPDARPEFYDFDLFKQAGQTTEMDNRTIGDLAYTVFDTETTGLDPKGGDEIISIGAVRIVNGRVLQDEQFDQLVNPKRNVPWESVKYHGIRPEMLQGQPAIDQVLPDFYHFVQGTILVGHNVAFDMRMLQMKEAETGVRFVNPVLDTMLLSGIVHPAQENHNLTTIAQRLGIDVSGRHTAMGDALATAHMFLKLIPLLEKKGIRTLQQARAASEKTYFARLRY